MNNLKLDGMPVNSSLLQREAYEKTDAYIVGFRAGQKELLPKLRELKEQSEEIRYFLRQAIEVIDSGEVSETLMNFLREVADESAG